MVVADDVPQIIKLAAKILEDQCELVGSAQNGFEAIEAIAQFQPEVLITDIEIPAMDGIRAARYLQPIESGLKVIFMSVSAEPEIVSAAMATGALGLVLKSRLATDLAVAVREVLAGRRFLP